MGSSGSKEIVTKSPLGCVLAHWKDLGGIPGSNVKKSDLMKYCICSLP